METGLHPSHSLREMFPRQLSRAFPKHSPLGISSSLSLCSGLVSGTFTVLTKEQKPINTLLKKTPRSIFIYKHRILCTFLKFFFFLCIFINERKMPSVSSLKGCKSTSLRIKCHLSAVCALSYSWQQSYQHSKVLVWHNVSTGEPEQMSVEIFHTSWRYKIEKSVE